MTPAITIRWIAEAMNARKDAFPDTLLDRSVDAISIDSRSVTPGSVFFALRGERVDGAAFIGEALVNGALCAVVDAGSVQREFATMPVLVVDDAVRALGDGARAYRELFAGPVVAVTGTCGKTTAKDMMAAALAANGPVHATPGNYNNLIGLPLSVFELETSDRVAVFELGMSAAGEIERLSAIVKPTVGVILNVGPGHMEFFDSIEAVADAKMELLGSIDSDGVAVLNADDPLLANAASRCDCRVVTFGIENDADYRASIHQEGADGCMTFTVNGRDIALSVPGRHMVYNALAAYAVSSELGVDASAVVTALESFTASDRRLTVTMMHGRRVIDDSYNANPLSMEAAARVLGSMKTSGKGRKIAVLGGMRELGAIGADAHVHIGGVFAETGADLLCLVGQESSLYEQGALATGMPPASVLKFPDAPAAAAFIRSESREGDVILVKGSRAYGMERIVSRLKEVN